MFAGAPDYIYSDAGNIFNSSELKGRVEEMGAVVRIAPTEARDRIGKVEKSHHSMKKG